MPAKSVPSSPTSPQTAKRGLEQEEAEMTDVPTEHHGEPKRRKERGVADSSSSSAIWGWWTFVQSFLETWRHGNFVRIGLWT